jgi:hypothetical protein
MRNGYLTGRLNHSNRGLYSYLTLFIYKRSFVQSNLTDFELNSAISLLEVSFLKENHLHAFFTLSYAHP